MQGESCKRARSVSCAKDQPTLSCPSSSTPNAGFEPYECDPESRRAGGGQREAVWKPKSKKSKAILPAFPASPASRFFSDFFLCSCFPDSFFFCCQCCDRFEEVHRIVCARRNRQTRAERCGNPGGTPRGHGRHDHSLGSAARRTD